MNPRCACIMMKCLNDHIPQQDAEAAAHRMINQSAFVSMVCKEVASKYRAMNGLGNYEHGDVSKNGVCCP